MPTADMTNDPVLNPTEHSVKNSPDPALRELVSEWQFAKIRFNRLNKQLPLKRELGLILGLLALLFAVPYMMWFHRWSLPGSMQGYAFFIIPIACFWVWVARYKLVLPEVEPIRKTLRVERRNRMRALKLGEREQTVLGFLVNEQPVIDRRFSFLLTIAVVVDLFAFWIRDPSLLALGFVLTAGGLVMYRFGIFAFRAALFPFLLLFTMIPLPGIILDAVQERVQPLVLGFVQHTMTNGGTFAEIPLEGEPLSISNNGVVYRLFADRAGLGVSEVILVLALTATFLSLVRMKHPLPKILVMTISAIWMWVLISFRLIVLCWISTSDREMATYLETISRYLIVPIGCAGCYLIARGLKCVKLHRWVSL